MQTNVDVVIIGGGIAGSSLATVLARKLLDVVVLERAETFSDRVRGESWMPWGVRVLRDLDLEKVLVDAGGIWMNRLAFYHADLPTEFSDSVASDLSGAVPEVPGALSIGHPTACNALAGAAADAGARVEMGVRSITYELDGDRPAISYTDASGGAHTLTARLLVGADGRGSGVRRAAGIELERAEPLHLITGMLLETDGGFRQDASSYGTADDVLWFSFPQPGGRTRLYLCHDTEERRRFAGPDGTSRFLATLEQLAGPERDAFLGASSSGPVATYTAEDTWTSQPYAPGVVLVGDAAGYNDPIIGQGLSLAAADVRDVRDVLAGDDWSPSAFTAYGAAKAARMQRQRALAALFATMFSTFDAESDAARLSRFARIGLVPEVSAVFQATFTGPEDIDDTAMVDAARELLLAPL